jgi:hypothetical protein
LESISEINTEGIYVQCFNDFDLIKCLCLTHAARSKAFKDPPDQGRGYKHLFLGVPVVKRGQLTLPPISDGHMLLEPDNYLDSPYFGKKWGHSNHCKQLESGICDESRCRDVNWLRWVMDSDEIVDVGKAYVTSLKEVALKIMK